MKMIWGFLFLLATHTLFPALALAADAEVLPKGNFAFNIDYKHYLPWDKRYNADGNVEAAATDFNAVIDSNVFPGLGDLENIFGIPANLGTTVTSFEYSYDRLEATLAYGLTDSLSIGFKIPYIRYKNKVEANLDINSATYGKNGVYQQGDPASNPLYDAPFVPIEYGGVKLTDNDFQNILGDGLDVNNDSIPDIPGYGYKRFETWEDQGLGDIEAGLKYRYYRSNDWRLAVLGGILFPTGNGPDPDNLAAQSLGGDGYALLFRSYNDYTGFKNLNINASAYYTLALPRKSEYRIVRGPHEPLSPLKESLDIDPGDSVEVETSISYHFDEQSRLPGATIEFLYHFTKKFRDEISGSGPDSLYSGLEDETNIKEHIYVARVAYSTIPLFLKNEFPIPMDISIAYRKKFAGENGVFKTEYLEGGLTIYF